MDLHFEPHETDRGNNRPEGAGYGQLSLRPHSYQRRSFDQCTVAYWAWTYSTGLFYLRAQFHGGGAQGVERNVGSGIPKTGCQDVAQRSVYQCGHKGGKGRLQGFAIYPAGTMEWPVAIKACEASSVRQRWHGATAEGKAAGYFFLFLHFWAPRCFPEQCRTRIRSIRLHGAYMDWLCFMSVSCPKCPDWEVLAVTAKASVRRVRLVHDDDLSRRPFFDDFVCRFESWRAVICWTTSGPTELARRTLQAHVPSRLPMVNRHVRCMSCQSTPSNKEPEEMRAMMRVATATSMDEVMRAMELPETGTYDVCRHQRLRRAYPIIYLPEGGNAGYSPWLRHRRGLVRACHFPLSADGSLEYVGAGIIIMMYLDKRFAPTFCPWKPLSGLGSSYVSLTTVLKLTRWANLAPTEMTSPWWQQRPCRARCRSPRRHPQVQPAKQCLGGSMGTSHCLCRLVSRSYVSFRKPAASPSRGASQSEPRWAKTQKRCNSNFTPSQSMVQFHWGNWQI